PACERRSTPPFRRREGRFLTRRLYQRHLRHIDAPPGESAFAIHEIEAPHVDEMLVEPRGQQAGLHRRFEPLAPLPQGPGIIEAKAELIAPDETARLGQSAKALLGDQAAPGKNEALDKVGM